MGEAEDKTKIKITIAKPIVGKKVFYFIQSIHAEKGTGAMLPAYRKDGSTTMGGEYIDEQTQQGRLHQKIHQSKLSWTLKKQVNQSKSGVLSLTKA